MTFCPQNNLLAYNDGDHSYTYDANNMVKTVDGGQYSYLYDSGGQRVMKLTPTETIYYVMGAGHYSSQTGWMSVFFKIAGIKVDYANGSTNFSQPNHLGTPVVETTVTGAVQATYATYPYGEKWEETGTMSSEHRYTGHVKDSETQMEYAGARYYASGKGRWGAVDPAARFDLAPQALNQFGYASNDPVGYRDLDGRMGTAFFRVETTFWQLIPPPEETPIVAGRAVGTTPDNSFFLAIALAAFQRGRPTPFSAGRDTVPGEAFSFLLNARLIEYLENPEGNCGDLLQPFSDYLEVAEQVFFVSLAVFGGTPLAHFVPSLNYTSPDTGAPLSLEEWFNRQSRGAENGAMVLRDINNNITNIVLLNPRFFDHSDGFWGGDEAQQRRIFFHEYLHILYAMTDASLAEELFGYQGSEPSREIQAFIDRRCPPSELNRE